MPWHVVHCPFSLKIFSPAATSCCGDTLPPSSDSSSGGFDSIWGIEFAYQVNPPITARANAPTLTVTGTAIGPLRLPAPADDGHGRGRRRGAVRVGCFRMPLLTQAA